jgi:CRISPR/Cas system-associated endonuclease Cas1
MPVQEDNKRGPRLVDQIEIIREPGRSWRHAKALLEDSLRDLNECVKQLNQLSSPAFDHERSNSSDYFSELQRKLERFRVQSKFLRRVMNKVH